MSERPEKVSGGCLCGSIRYNITFPQDSAWPPNTCSCQCGICRKFSGSLISHDLILSPQQLSDMTQAPTYKDYQSSEGGFRSFCSNCGSGLTWKLSFVPDMIIVFLGTIDEEYLMGHKIDGSEQRTDMGLTFKREGGLYKELTSMNYGHIFWNNRIPGVTDQDSLAGPKFPGSFPME